MILYYIHDYAYYCTCIYANIAVIIIIPRVAHVSNCRASHSTHTRLSSKVEQFRNSALYDLTCSIVARKFFFLIFVDSIVRGRHTNIRLIFFVFNCNVSV